MVGVISVTNSWNFLESLPPMTWNFKLHLTRSSSHCWSCSFAAYYFTLHLPSPTMKFPTLAVLSLTLLSSSSSCSSAFVGHRAPQTISRCTAPRLLSSSTDNDTNAVLESLTPELTRMTQAFSDIGDDKLRYKQLLYMANQLPPLKDPESVMLPKNKVPGCLSTVYIDGTASYNPKKKDYTVEFVGESDGLLTKGLVALLVRCVRVCVFVSV